MQNSLDYLNGSDEHSLETFNGSPAPQNPTQQHPQTDMQSDPLAPSEEPPTQDHILAPTYVMPTPFSQVNLKQNPMKKVEVPQEECDGSTDSSVCTDVEPEMEHRTVKDTEVLAEGSKTAKKVEGTNKKTLGRYLFDEKIESEYPGPTCMGCDDLDCILDWKSVRANLPRSNGEAIQWMDGHKFFTRRVCSEHPTATLKYHPKGYFTCTHKCGKTKSGQQQLCRRRVGLLEPFQSNKAAKISVHDLLVFWALCADNNSAKSKANMLDLAPSTISHLTKKTSLACHASLTFNVLVFTNVQVDESYVGSRKDHRGRRARRQGYWFVTVTEVCQKTGRSLRTRWHPVTFRTKEQLTNIVRSHLASAKTVVTTDSFRSYNYLSEICRHKKVNHKLGFTAKDNVGRTVHTNNAENCHSVIKSWCKKEHNRYGLGSQNLQRNIALQTVKFDKDSPDQKGCWQKRYINILRAVRTYYTHEEQEDIPEIDVNTKSPEYKQHQEDWLKRYAKNIAEEEVQLLQDVTVKKIIEGKVKYIRSNQVKVDPVGKWDLKEWEKEAVRDALKSCEPGHMLESHIITMLLPVCTGRRKTTYRLLDPELMRLSEKEELEWSNDVNCDIIAPVCHDNHWILLVWSQAQQALLMYDSLYKKRPEFTNAVMKVFSKALSRRITSIMYIPSPQQTTGSNDCGIHLMNNALAFLEPDQKPTVSRSTLFASAVTNRTAQGLWKTYFASRGEDWFFEAYNDGSEADDEEDERPKKKPTSEAEKQKKKKGGK